MNFLGHSRISMEIDIKTMYGNFTGDFYKGRLENLKLPTDVKNGLFLHRKIDSISDTGNILTERIDKKANPRVWSGNMDSLNVLLSVTFDGS